MHNYQNDNTTNAVVLVVNDYGNPCGGELMRLFDYNRFKSIETDIEKAKTDIAELSEDMADETRNKVINFASLLNDASTNIEPFIFFTDPHLCQFNGMAWRAEFDQYMRHLKNVFNEAPVDRVICGGDWIGNGEYRWEVCHRLGLIDSTMRANFVDKYHLVVGNHDTNYQGRIDANSENGTGRLTNNAIINYWGRKHGRLYYKVKSVNTDFYFLDTNAPDNDADMNSWDAAYIESQLVWLAEELQMNNDRNVAIIGHIFCMNDNGWMFGAIQPLQSIITAFNNRSSVTVGGQTFNYANATGKIRFCMSGHTHNDVVNTIGGIPFVRTTQMREGGKPTYDLCLADYEKNKLHLIRIGTGEDRTLDI
jgi:predicted phosphodiesterase